MIRPSARRCRVVVFALVLAACQSAKDAPKDAPRDAQKDALAESPTSRGAANLMQVMARSALPTAPPGTMARDSSWRTFIDTSGTPSVYLIHRVAALVVPDGPIELTEPVIGFRFYGEHWVESRGPRATGSLPPAARLALEEDFEERERSYFYLVRLVDAGADSASATGLEARVFTTAREMSAAVTRYLRDGFISADAEP